jgi:hypothetical protein
MADQLSGKCILVTGGAKRYDDEVNRVGREELARGPSILKTDFGD